MENDLKKITVKRMWDEFSARTFPEGEDNVYPVQLVETRKAFYGGVGRTLIALRELGGESLSVEEGVAKLQEMVNEVGKFWDKELENYKA